MVSLGTFCIERRVSKVTEGKISLLFGSRIQPVVPERAMSRLNGESRGEDSEACYRGGRCDQNVMESVRSVRGRSPGNVDSTRETDLRRGSIGVPNQGVEEVRNEFVA